MKKRAFTLIELLIVVAIIAILAAIAVPNFLEAQIRAKVSRAKADMRSMATAIEAYIVDNNKPPSIIAPTSPWPGPLFDGGGSGINGPSIFEPTADFGVSSRMIWVTTPISYMTSVPRDPFVVKFARAPIGDAFLTGYDSYDYVDALTLSPDGISSTQTRAASICSGAMWHLVSAGPDGRNCFGGGHVSSSGASLSSGNDCGWDYDPTNGTVSAGDIVRIGSAPGPLYSELPKVNRITGEYN